eukprot:g2900.t1
MAAILLAACFLLANCALVGAGKHGGTAHHAPMCTYINPHKHGPYKPTIPLVTSALPCGTKFTSDEVHPDFLCAFEGSDCIEYRVRADVDVSVCFSTKADWERYGDEVTLHPRLCPCTNTKRCRMTNSDLTRNGTTVLFVSPDEPAIARVDVRARRCADADDSVVSLTARIGRETLASFNHFKQRQFSAAVAASVDIGAEDSHIVFVGQASHDAIDVDLELSLVHEAALERAVSRIRSPAFAAEVISEMSEDGYYQLTGLKSTDMTFTVTKIEAPQRLPWFDVVLGALAVVSFVAAYALYRMWKDGVLGGARRRMARRRRARDEDDEASEIFLGSPKAERTRGAVRQMRELSGTSAERAGIIKSAMRGAREGGLGRRSGAGLDQDGVRRRSSAKDTE